MGTDNLTLFFLAFGFLVQVGALVWWASGVNSRQREHRDTLSRHEGLHSTWPDKLSSAINPINERLNRHSERFDKTDQAAAQRDSATAAALAELKSQVTALLGSVNRLIDAEQARIQHQQPATRTLVDQLKDFVEIQALLNRAPA